MDPFIEAEQAIGNSIKRCCCLFEVSRAAYYERRQGVPSVREITDTQLTEKIKAIHATSNGTYGACGYTPSYLEMAQDVGFAEYAD
jgi:hypothetical protein